MLWRNKEWEKDGSTGWTTEACACTSVEEIRSKKFRVPKDRPLKKSEAQTAAPEPETSATFTEEDEGELPF